VAEGASRAEAKFGRLSSSDCQRGRRSRVTYSRPYDTHVHNDHLLDIHDTAGTLDFAEVRGVVWSGRSHSFNWTKAASALFTDEHKAYDGLDADFAFKQMYHSRGGYVSGDVYTNGIENYWSLLKRSLKGRQIHVSPDHLHRYVTDHTFAYNNHGTDDLGRMRLATAGANGAASPWRSSAIPRMVTVHLVGFVLPHLAQFPHQVSRCV